jgi:enoyl-CoA hydratase
MMDTMNDTDTTFTRLTLERRDDGVRILTLNDPDKRNAIGPELREELVAAGRALAADAEARCLVVTGAGSAFCAGADLGQLFDVEGATPSAMRARQLSYYESFLALRALPYPTVAAVHGPAVGAGLNLALVCDIVVAGPGARFGVTFAKLGLHPGGGCTYYVTQRLGAGRALRTILLGRTLGGEEACTLGLADELADDPLATAIATAERIAALEPSLARDMKQAVAIAATGDFDATVGFEAHAQAASAFNPGVIEGIRAAGRTTRR